MNKKKLMLALALVALVVVATVGGTLAYFTDKDTRANVITMGKVSGTLTETGEKPRQDGTTGLDFNNIRPGQIIEKDPKVTLKSDSEDAYARIKIVYTGLNETQITDLEALLSLNNGWKKAADGYFYYNTKLSAGQSSTLFNTVTIPPTWGNEIAGQTFNMNITAEFIQADYFTPTVENGFITSWGSVSIQAYQ